MVRHPSRALANEPDSTTVFCAALLFDFEFSWLGYPYRGFSLPQHGHWAIWVTGVLTIGAVHFACAIIVQQQWQPDPSGNQLAAEILKAL